VGHADAPAAYVRALGFDVERMDQSYVQIEDDGTRQQFDYTAPVFDYEGRLVYDTSRVGPRLSGHRHPRHLIPHALGSEATGGTLTTRSLAFVMQRHETAEPSVELVDRLAVVPGAGQRALEQRRDPVPAQERDMRGLARAADSNGPVAEGLPRGRVDVPAVGAHRRPGGHTEPTEPHKRLRADLA
jgi:hypothetical protein